MLGQAVKAVVVAAAAAVAVPYTLAVVANTLYGWPRGPGKYKRALQPRKVYCLSYAILRQLKNLRYASLYFRWRYFYAYATTDRLIKDIPYGRNNNQLDVYRPREARADAAPLPVVVFVYGGAWGSGDKAMYGLLCSQLADSLTALVVCPNYAIYPKGYVDDMVQDVVDTLGWIHQNAHDYNADKERLLVVGHSSGAHLAAMATLELVMRRLLHEQNTASPAGASPSASPSLARSMRFEESYFNHASTATDVQEADPGAQGDQEMGLDGEGSEEKETVVERADEVDMEEKQSDEEVLAAGEEQEEVIERQEQIDISVSGGAAGVSTTDSFFVVSEAEKQAAESFMLVQSEEEQEERGVEQELEDARAEDGERAAASLAVSGLGLEGVERQMSQSQREARDTLASIRAVIGLAGVYHIGEHFAHEAWRGVEDISAMAKAMYAPEFFDRFSPAHIVPNLPRHARFPPVRLIHGTEDTTVPAASSTKFGQALWELGVPHVQVTLLPGCGHTDVCIDLMDPARTWYSPVMTAVLETAAAFL